MLTHERQRELLLYMRSGGGGKVNDLAQAIGASPSTVRRDLREMDEQGLLVRVHGGASLVDSPPEGAHVTRQHEHAAEKRRIGATAAAMVADHSTILITGGTTTEAMLGFLTGRKGLTVVTNALNVAMQLSQTPDITVVVLGGVLRAGELSLLGPRTEHALEEFRISTAFAGVYGIDYKVGLTGAFVQEASTDRRLLEGVDSLIVLADSSKFMQHGPVRMAKVSQISTLITDTGAPVDHVRALSQAGVDVRVV